MKASALGYDDIEQGDQVTIRIGGHNRKGTAAFTRPKDGFWLLSWGTYGRPILATPTNFVKVRKRKKENQ